MERISEIDSRLRRTMRKTLDYFPGISNLSIILNIELHLFLPFTFLKTLHKVISLLLQAISLSPLPLLIIYIYI